MTAATSRSMPRARRPGEAFLIAGLALVLVVALSATAVRAYAKATRVADHIVGVRHEAEEWLRVLLDAETAVRGYVASGEPIFLEPYATAVVAERKQAAAVLALIAADRAVAELGDLAGRDAQSTMSGLGEMVSLVRAGRRTAALAVLASGEGKRRMDRFRQDVQSAAPLLQPDDRQGRLPDFWQALRESIAQSEQDSNSRDSRPGHRVSPSASPMTGSRRNDRTPFGLEFFRRYY